MRLMRMLSIFCFVLAGVWVLSSLTSLEIPAGMSRPEALGFFFGTVTPPLVLLGLGGLCLRRARMLAARRDAEQDRDRTAA